MAAVFGSQTVRRRLQVRRARPLRGALRRLNLLARCDTRLRRGPGPTAYLKAEQFGADRKDLARLGSERRHGAVGR